MIKYKTLTKENYNDYLNDVYASWLGKIIGIRLGAPVENWNYQKIRDTYKYKHGYLCDYGIFASDDDSNGPLFFVRALENNNCMTSEDVGNALLNYLQEYNGFFWWGGVGVSSEHTAYENLKNGIKAPKSGAIETNGLTIAEQIGGQIFSDCWGYVAGYDPNTAKDLAIKAASVTHDKNGVQGAVFVAVAICLAMQSNDINEVLEETLEYLDDSMEYYRVVKDIINFKKNNLGDFEQCFKYIRDYYGYDKYPGTCHIIPNSAIMVMSMIYGDNDFSKTLESLNYCGWDTDCNCGNVGSIMGALVGINNIDQKWIEPINDIVNASSCIGSLNIQTVSESSKYFVKLAYQIKNIDISDISKNKLKYQTFGFFRENNQIFKYVYYLSNDVYDARYTPVYSPTVYTGDKIIFTLKANNAYIKLFVQGCDGSIYRSNNFIINDQNTVFYKVPAITNLIINKIGIETNENVEIIDYQVEHTPIIDFTFNNHPIDKYSPVYNNEGEIFNLRGFVPVRGTFDVNDNGVTVENALISSGHINGKYNSLILQSDHLKGNGHFVVFNMKGARKYYKFGIKDNTAYLICVNNDETIIKNKIIDFDFELLNIRIYIEDEIAYFEINKNNIFAYPMSIFEGLFGFECVENSSFNIYRLIIN